MKDVSVVLLAQQIAGSARELIRPQRDAHRVRGRLVDQRVPSVVVLQRERTERRAELARFDQQRCSFDGRRIPNKGLQSVEGNRPLIGGVRVVIKVGRRVDLKSGIEEPMRSEP